MNPYFKLEAGAQLDSLTIIQSCLEYHLEGVLLLEVDLPIELFDLSSGLDLRTADLKDLDRVVQSWDPDGKSIPLDQAERQILWMTANHRELAAGDMTHLCLAVIDKKIGEGGSLYSLTREGFLPNR